MSLPAEENSIKAYRSICTLGALERALSVKYHLSQEVWFLFKFHPAWAGLALIVLLLGFHQYQIHNNPCYGVLRLHVVANSDSPRDQAVKLKVRDSILDLMQARFAGVDDPREARQIAAANLKDIEWTAAMTLAASGEKYPVKACLGNFEFPTRFYGSQVFPPGEYTAVRVVLGEGNGRNWWCVLFPPLCLGDLNGNGNLPPEGIEVRLKVWEALQHNSWILRMASN